MPTMSPGLNLGMYFVLVCHFCGSWSSLPLYERANHPHSFTKPHFWAELPFFDILSGDGYIFLKLPIFLAWQAKSADIFSESLE
jgi:hypothetical protein